MSDSYKIYASQDYVDSKGLPDGAEANMQLVTDADGVAKWEEKPFYSTQEEITVTWDGDTTDREVIDMGDGEFYKVSDSIIPRDNAIGITFTVTTESGSEDHVITEDICRDVSEVVPGAWVVLINRKMFLGSGPAFNAFGSSGGIYYFKTGNEYTSSMTHIDVSIKTIDQKYIPDISSKYLAMRDPVGFGTFSMNRLAESKIGVCSHAEGMYTTASGSYSHAEGYYTTASNNYSHAEGNYTSASGSYSHVEGNYTIAASYGQHVQGKYNVEDANDVYAHIVGNGSEKDKRSNAHTLDWEGNAWFAGTIEGTALIIKSSTSGSTKRFKITVDDSGTLTATEVTE